MAGKIRKIPKARIIQKELKENSIPKFKVIRLASIIFFRNSETAPRITDKQINLPPRFKDAICNFVYSLFLKKLLINLRST